MGILQLPFFLCLFVVVVVVVPFVEWLEPSDNDDDYDVEEEEEILRGSIERMTPKEEG